MARRALASYAAALLCFWAVAGCGSGADSGSGSGTTLPVRQVTVTITGGQIAPKPSTVSVTDGQTVEITVTSDKADELHVHGIDKELELAAGTPGTLRFTATPTGTYEVETHTTDKLLFTLQVKPR